MPLLVSIYAFFQLLAVVLLLNYLQGVDLSYSQGVGGWAIVLATTVNTALWLNGLPADRLPKWDLLRLLTIAILTWLSPDAPVWWVAAYCGLNVLFLPLIARAPVRDDAKPVGWLYRVMTGEPGSPSTSRN